MVTGFLWRLVRLASAFGLLGTTTALAVEGSVCSPGNSVIVGPGDHPATVLSGDNSSCRVHYKDGAFPDGWTYTFNVRPADLDAKNRAAAAAGPRPGRYDITVGAGAYDGYIVIGPNGSYELFLPGDKSAGSGTYDFDAAALTVHWRSGPLTDPGWDGTQQLRGDGPMLKIDIGKDAVATRPGG